MPRGIFVSSYPKLYLKLITIYTCHCYCYCFTFIILYNKISVNNSINISIYISIRQKFIMYGILLICEINK